jgi:hypothetical protein
MPMSDVHPPPPPPLPPDNDQGRTGPPWEQPGPWLGRFVDTARGVLTDPRGTFAAMRRTGGLASPLAFAIIGVLVGSFATLVYQTVGAGASLLPILGGRTPGVGSVIATLVITPVIATLSLFVFAGLFHAVLLLLNGAKQPFEATFRTYAYASGATAVLGIIPVCGGIVGAVWGIVATIIGLAKAHDTTTGTAAVAVLVPVTICCGTALLIFGASMLALAGLAALAGTH